MNHRAVAWWLLACAALVFAIVVVGGVTRLTHSGLSIVEWQPVVGAVPPLDDAQWQEAFDKYKQTPEYLQVNRGMTLPQFKGIFWWEYIHRLLGRLIGAVFRTGGFKAEEAAIEARARELLTYVGIAKYADYKARTLSYGDQRRLEIARALATEPKLIALDEPAAGMNATEKGVLRDLILRIRKDGRTILLIEHDMKLVMSLCDRVLVLDYGKKIAEGPAAVVQKDEKVISAYLGADVALDVKRA